MIDKSSINLLRLIKKLNKDEVGCLMEYLNDKSVNNICECVYNIIHTDLKLPGKKKLMLKNHIKKNCCVKRLKQISNKKVPLFKRRQALKQEGKGLPALLAAAIPFLINLFTK